VTVVVTDPAKRGVDGTVERAGEALAHRLLLNTDLLPISSVSPSPAARATRPSSS